MPHTSAIPDFYYFCFAVYEPLLTTIGFVGAWLYVRSSFFRFPCYHSNDNLNLRDPRAVSCTCNSTLYCPVYAAPRRITLRRPGRLVIHHQRRFPKPPSFLSSSSPTSVHFLDFSTSQSFIPLANTFTTIPRCRKG